MIRNIFLIKQGSSKVINLIFFAKNLVIQLVDNF